MRTIKSLLLSLCAVVAVACELNEVELPNEMQKFPEAAFYLGDLTQMEGEEQSVRHVYIELHKLDDGGYSLAIGDEGTNIQGESQYILFNKLDGELSAGVLSLVGDNVVGKINLSEHTFASLGAELTADKAIIALDFGEGKSWYCEVDAVRHMLE